MDHIELTYLDEQGEVRVVMLTDGGYQLTDTMLRIWGSGRVLLLPVERVVLLDCQEKEHHYRESRGK